MMKFISAADKIFDVVIKYLCYLAAVLLVLMALSISLDVILRYTINNPLKWVFEATEYSLLFITFLGTTWVLQKDEHVKLDLVLGVLGPRLRAGVNAFTSLIMVVVCLVITWSSIKYTLYLFENDVTLIQYYTIPKFTIYAIIPVGFFLLSIQSLRRTYQYLRQI